VENFHGLLLYVALFCVTATIGFYLIARGGKLFLFVRSKWLRRNIVTFLIGLCFFFAVGHLIPDFRNVIHYYGWWTGFLFCMMVVIADVLIPYNIILFLTENPRFAGSSLLKQQVRIFLSIVLTTILVNGTLNYFINGTTQYLKYSVVWSFYMSVFGSLVYLFIRQYDQEKKKKLFEKELEVVKLNEQKTKAELDALHSRINPHFLYNALNSIADLAVTDGRKARSMTVSLAELFRYSINYSNSNYATVEEELEVTKLYLEIEKIRFEDKLFYTIEASTECLNTLVPKFILQPVVENAVKHGLKATGQLTQIKVEVFADGDNLVIKVYDNGPNFPSQLNPGYGLKSVYDKLELLFPNRFEIKMNNGDQKNFEIRLKS
jgi:two-component system LytT family sensor kinase